MTSPAVTFRPATLDDSDAITEVLIASRRAFLTYAPSPHTDDEVRDYVRSALIPQAQVTLPVVDGRIVGVMALKRADGFGWVEQFYLHPDVVGRGIGSELIEQAKAALGPPMRLWAFQQNTGARRFYQRHGFHAITFTDGAENEERCPDVLFEWKDES